MVDWKKEIKLSKDQDAAEPKAEYVPFWKKEISIGRKARSTQPPAAEAKTPFWKKEIGGGKKRKVEPADAEANTPETGGGKKQNDDHVPFWKKEISVGRKRKVAPPAPEVVAEEVAVEPLPPAESDAVVLERLARVAEVVDAETVVPAEPVAELEPTPELEPAPELEDDGVYGWVTSELAHAAEAMPAVERVEEEPPVVEEPEAVAEVAPELEPEPEPVETPSAFVAPHAVVAETPPVLTPYVEAVPAPLPGIHPPVPAAELPPLPGEDPEPLPEKKSGLRREISLKRKPKEKKPKQAGEKTPFWKKQLGKKKDADAPVEQPAAVVEEPKAWDENEKKPPFWKRELGDKRGPKQEKPKRERAPKEKRERGAKEPRAKRPKRTKGHQHHKKLVGLKIGASQIAAARVVNNGSAQVVQLAREPLEAGIVVGGELRDPDALAEALKNFFRRNKLPRRGIRLGIANNRIGVRSFDLEGIEDPKQLENAIRFRAQEALPIPIEEAVLDYQVLGERVDEEGATVRRVLLVVAYKELIDRYVDACRKAGIRLVGIDLEAFALLRALGEPREATDALPDAATVAVAVGYDRSTFAVSDGRICEFTRVLEWGGFAVNVAIARALDIAPSEAEPVKRLLSLEDEAVPEGLTAEQAAAARDAMRKQVSSFARELVSSLQFYQSQPGSLSIAGITVTGGSAHLPGFAAELQRLIGVPVVVGDPLARVKAGKKLKTGEQVGSFAVAIGLGIED